MSAILAHMATWPEFGDIGVVVGTVGRSCGVIGDVIEDAVNEGRHASLSPERVVEAAQNSGQALVPRGLEKLLSRHPGFMTSGELVESLAACALVHAREDYETPPPGVTPHQAWADGAIRTAARES